MLSLISMLDKSEQMELLNDLNYLNLDEIKAFCKKHSIPYSICIETEDGERRRTSEQDRKGIILNRVRHFLKTGVVLQETYFPARVTCFDPLPVPLTIKHRLFYGQYDRSRAMIALLKSLTGGKFRDGAIARMLAREFWSRGEAPTYEQFAAAWLRALAEHRRPNPEWAFLSDIVSKTAGADWKELRVRKARRVMKILNDIAGK